MQIFMVEDQPQRIARSLCDKHVVSQIGETAEMLAIAHVRNGEHMPPMLTLNARKRHLNHPCPVWVGTTEGNYLFAYQLAVQLCNEYTHRYKRQHQYELDIGRMMYAPFKLMHAALPLTPNPIVVPDVFRCSSLMQSYRQYYHYKSQQMPMHWTNRQPPHWFLLME